jgi:TQXA domain-containing protein/LPXTG-motif cell wall-anchored protein
MTIAQRAASRRGAAAVVASLALAAGLVGTFAAPSSAQEPSTAEFQGSAAQDMTIKGSFPNTAPGYFQAGLEQLLIDGTDTEVAYCIDFVDDIRVGDVLPEADWDTSDVANRDAVGRILGSYYPIGSGPAGYEIEGNERQRAAATQAALWHFTNDFTLLEASTPEDEVALPSDYTLAYANYLKILQAVDDGVLPAVGGHVTFTIEGDTDVNAIPGQLIGPFTIHTSVASVDLVVSGGTIHNADGTAFDGPASDGNEVWLKASEAGTVKLSGVATGVESGVRLFGSDELQDMAFLIVTPREVPAEIKVTVKPTPTTSNTTPDNPTTTDSIVPQQGTTPTTATPTTTRPSPAGGLPDTGANTLGLVAVALVLLSAGVGFGVYSRRRGQSST